MIRTMIRCMAVVAGAVTLTACTTNNLYYWGDYEQALFAYTKQPGEIDNYIASLNDIIVEAEKRGQVPPGIYAEYGYALMTAGREDEAMAYFQKERSKWPESGTLMGLMIDGGGFPTDSDQGADEAEVASNE